MEALHGTQNVQVQIVVEANPDDIFTDPGTPVIEDQSALSPEDHDLAKQRAYLDSYLKSLPYPCETEEQMHTHLEHIFGRIAVCAETKNWMVLTTWDGLLECWLLMRYPIPKALRAKLVRLYYELCLLPGIEPRITRSWMDMTIKLLAHKLDGRRKLEPSDLSLQWKPLWRVLQKDLWGRGQHSARSMTSQYLSLAEHCSRYYSPDDVPTMLEEFVPVLNQEVFTTTMIPVMVSFFPLRRPSLYLAMLFRIWEASNSNITDDRMIELAGALAEEHVAGTAGDAGAEDGESWKDVGIWTEKQWSLLVGKALSSMHVPVGGNKGINTTGLYADLKGGQMSSSRTNVKKMANRIPSLARLFVNSMSVDGPSRPDPSASTAPASSFTTPPQPGYLAGSKALDSLDKLLTSTETYFHPSNSGVWSLSLTSFVASLASEFSKRWQEEQQPLCKIPAGQRLTPAIRRAFVSTLRTPVLLGMFAKDSASMIFAQAAMKYLAVLEPTLIMPELLERAYGGLESVNETHRTTAVLSMLSFIVQPLVNEKIYLGGQKHILPLLELCVPGIDLNDPSKTMFTAGFISAIAQNIKMGDLSSTQSGVPLSSDEPLDSVMDVDTGIHMPDGSEAPVLSREDERILVRESTAGFADWVTSFLRRVLALYENLPEEGGKSNTTGGRSEENVLKSLRSSLDMVFLSLSEPLFDLVLRVVYDYATTNAKSNAVKAFGGLVGSLGRANAEKTVNKFLPFCVAQIKEELKHGASSIRSTSVTAALPSDTTLHWNIAILKACFQYDGQIALRHRDTLLDVIRTLQEKTLSERGYSATGRMLHRLLLTLSTVYPRYGRFVNTDEWESPEFNRDHNLHWGRSYKYQDVDVEWHTPSDEEIAFILQILDELVMPTLDKVDQLLETAGTWDNVARNDFCRYLTFCRQAWGGLPTFLKEASKDIAWSGIDRETEVEGLIVSQLLVQAGFVLTDPTDSRYQRAVAHRQRFGQILHHAAQVLSQEHEGKDHIDAVLVVNRAIDTYLTDYGVDAGDFGSQQKNYLQARETGKIWPKQRTHSRLVLVRRAQLHHSARVYVNGIYRRRDALDDELIKDLAVLSLSPYLRVRRQAQSVLLKVCSTFVRSTRMVLPTMFSALERGSDPDRMKGALYVLWNKGTAMYAISDPKDPALYGQYLLALLNCQHQEKPSIQQLVGSLSKDAVTFLEEEAIRTDSYTDDVPGVVEAMHRLAEHFSSTLVDNDLLHEALEKDKGRIAVKTGRYDETVASIVQLASQPSTHWRYVYWSLKFLYGLIRRDTAPSADVAKLFMRCTMSPHSSLRSIAQKGITKLATFIKIRTYSKSPEEAWLHEWASPLQVMVPIHSDPEFYEYVQRPVDAEDTQSSYFIDKVTSGFVAWRPYTKAYKLPPTEDGLPIAWDEASLPAIRAIEEAIQEDKYFERLGELWSQESNKDSKPEVRPDNVCFTKSLAKLMQGEHVDQIMDDIEGLLSDSDRFKQRAAAEFLAGIVRGSKHWSKGPSQKIWAWAVKWLDFKYKELKPDTLAIWETCVSTLLNGRDPRRNPELISWILSLPTDFQSESAFSITKALSMLGCFVDYVGYRDTQLVQKHFDLFLSNANIAYAELRVMIAENIFLCITNLWAPCHPSVHAFLDACKNSEDPLGIRNAPFKDRIAEVAQQLATWKEERLPPPRVNQSQYDKVGLTLLRWVWISCFGGQATLLFPFLLPLLPEFMRMTELSDNPELQTHSQAVLNIISAVTPPAEFIGPIVDIFVDAIKLSKSWRIRLHAMRPLIVFFYRNMLGISEETAARIMSVLLDCLADDNVEVREMASKTLSGLVRVSQRQSIAPLLERFRVTVRRTKLPARQDAAYADSIRTLHAAILGLCALVESFPYSVEKWMPPVTDVLAAHATDPPPISTTIRKTASEFKKTHQDTWHKDQMAFDEDQLQNLSTMLVGTSYYA